MKKEGFVLHLHFLHFVCILSLNYCDFLMRISNCSIVKGVLDASLPRILASLNLNVEIDLLEVSNSVASAMSNVTGISIDNIIGIIKTNALFLRRICCSRPSVALKECAR